MKEILSSIQLILVLALAAGVATLAIYGYKKYLEPFFMSQAVSQVEANLQRVNAANNREIAQIKASTQIVATQIQSIGTSVDVLSIDKVTIQDLTVMAEGLKELSRSLDATSKRLGQKVPSPIGSIFASSNPQKQANNLANRAGYYGNDATISFWNAVTTKYQGKYKDMNVFLALSKEEQDTVINAVKKHNLPVNR